MLGTFLRGALKSSSAKKHDLNWNRWLKFLSAREEEDDPYLTTRSNAGKGQALGLFVMWLRSDEGYSAETAIRCLSSVSNAWKEDSREIGIFSEPYLATVRKAARGTSGTPRELNKRKLEKQRMPVVLEMVEWLRVKYGTGDLFERMTYLGVALSYHFMFRVSEYVFGSVNNEHWLHGEDVDFISEDDTRVRPGDVSKHKTGTKMVLILLRSRKNDQTGRGQRMYVTRRTPLESQLLDDLISFCAESGGGAEEPLFCRYKNGRCLKLTNRHLKEALNLMANHFGFEECIFACHSMRIGGRCSSKTAGATRDQLRHVGGWADGSSADLSYEHGTPHDVGTLGLHDRGKDNPILSVSDVRNMMPPGWEQRNL
jgi:hypothetical protein